MRLLTIIAILCILMFAVACVPEPEEINITIEKEVEEIEEDTDEVEEILEEGDTEIEKSVEEVQETLEEKPEENKTGSPSPITGGAVVDTGPRTIIADGMIEVEEGENVRVIVPN